MAYVDAMHNREKDEIRVVERINGERVYRNIPVNHVFYYTDVNGTHRSIFGDTVKKFSSNSKKAWTSEKYRLQGRTIFESDINPVFRCLEENYLGVETPILNLCFFDIETAFSNFAYQDTHKVQTKVDNVVKEMNVHQLSVEAKKGNVEVFDTTTGEWVDPITSPYLKPGRGFAPIDDPFNDITAITIYLSSLGKMITLCSPPPTMTYSEALEISNKFEDTILFESEAELLDCFLDLIEDADVISGWNSTGFDIPYTVNRIARILGNDANRRWNLWDQMPKRREYIKFKKKNFTYDLIGRIHLDYLELYQKHNPQQLHSYRLDFVGEHEECGNKTTYEGTLDDLYKKDFFRFIEYNRQDVMLLVKIDKKKRFIELANQIAHTNTVLLKTTMGSVALIEQAITNFAHSKGLVIPDRKPRPIKVEEEEEEDFDDDDDDDIIIAEEEKAGAVGAYVAKPKVGIHDEVGACDINSLYPSTLRALGMSPETLVGHIRPTATDALIASRIAAKVPKSDLWEGVFATVEYEQVMAKTNDMLTVDFQDGTVITATAAELHSYIFEQGRPLVISANGTLFRTDIEGVIPGLLAEWYSQRKEMQAREKIFTKLLDGGIDLGGLDLS